MKNSQKKEYPAHIHSISGNSVKLKKGDTVLQDLYEVQILLLIYFNNYFILSVTYSAIFIALLLRFYLKEMILIVAVTVFNGYN